MIRGRLNELSLYTGAGGGLLGSILLGWRTVCAVENNPYCISVLKARQTDGHLEPFPIWDDARTFDGRPWAGKVDVLSGGFPCQPFSVAGRGLGPEDPRNLWPETARIIGEVGPRFVFLENSPNLRTKRHGYYGTVLSDLAALGYNVRWDCIPAASVGAPHQRDRLWVLGWNPDGFIEEEVGGEGRGEIAQSGGDDLADSQRTERGPDDPSGGRHQGADDYTQGQEGPVWSGGGGPEMAHPQGLRRCPRGAEPEGEQGGSSPTLGGSPLANPQGQPLRSGLRAGGAQGERRGRSSNGGSSGDWWFSESGIRRVAHGVADRVERLKAVGNGQVPPVVVRAWEHLTQGLSLQ